MLDEVKCKVHKSSYRAVDFSAGTRTTTSHRCSRNDQSPVCSERRVCTREQQVTHPPSNRPGSSEFLIATRMAAFIMTGIHLGVRMDEQKGFNTSMKLSLAEQ
jgi:hypothetical protein